MHSCRRFALIVFSLLPAVSLAQGLPPSVHVPSGPEAAPAAFAAPARASRTIALPAPTQAAISEFRARRRAEAKPGQPYPIGFAREVNDVARTVNGTSLAWVVVPGGHAAKFDVTSPGAQGLRLALKIDGPRVGVTLRFAGSMRTTEVFEVAATDTAGTARYWGPETQGDVQTVEVFVANGVLPQTVRFSVESVMHLETFAAGPQLRDIGDADSCERDIACRPNPTQQFLDTAKAVARITFVSGGQSFLCSGTLVNNTQSPRAATFVTANHCISSQSIANTVTSYWFFDATACNNNRAGDFKVVQGGATPLFNDTQRDHALLQIRGALPAGVVFAGWTPAPVTSNTSILGLHHPAGDLKKYSEGRKTADVSNQIGLSGPFHQVVWNLGVTEGGSSGSGLFIFNSQVNNYQLVGQLLGGASFCSRPRDPDVYGRFQDVFTDIRRFLEPTAPPLAVVNAASFTAGGVAGQQLVAGFGAELPVGSLQASAGCPTELGGRYSVNVTSGANRWNACVLFIGARQVNFVMPQELFGVIPGQVGVEVFDRTLGRAIGAQSGLQSVSVAPGIFTATANGQGLPAANLLRVKPDGRQIYENVANPQDPRQPIPIDLSIAEDRLFLVLYPTGVRGRATLADVEVKVAGIPAEVQFAGPQGGFFGLDQINVLLPRDELIAAGIPGNKTIVEVSVKSPDGTTLSANPVDLHFR